MSCDKLNHRTVKCDDCVQSDDQVIFAQPKCDDITITFPCFDEKCLDGKVVKIKNEGPCDVFVESDCKCNPLGDCCEKGDCGRGRCDEGREFYKAYGPGDCGRFGPAGVGGYGSCPTWVGGFAPGPWGGGGCGPCGGGGWGGWGGGGWGGGCSPCGPWGGWSGIPGDCGIPIGPACGPCGGGGWGGGWGGGGWGGGGCGPCGPFGPGGPCGFNCFQGCGCGYVGPFPCGPSCFSGCGCGFIIPVYNNFFNGPGPCGSGAGKCGKVCEKPRKKAIFVLHCGESASFLFSFCDKEWKLIDDGRGHERQYVRDHGGDCDRPKCDKRPCDQGGKGQSHHGGGKGSQGHSQGHSQGRSQSHSQGYPQRGRGVRNFKNY